MVSSKLKLLKNDKLFVFMSDEDKSDQIMSFNVNSNLVGMTDVRIFDVIDIPILFEILSITTCD